MIIIAVLIVLAVYVAMIVYEIYLQMAQNARDWKHRRELKTNESPCKDCPYQRHGRCYYKHQSTVRRR